MNLLSRDIYFNELCARKMVSGAFPPHRSMPQHNAEIVTAGRSNLLPYSRDPLNDDVVRKNTTNSHSIYPKMA